MVDPGSAPERDPPQSRERRVETGDTLTEEAGLLGQSEGHDIEDIVATCIVSMGMHILISKISDGKYLYLIQ